MRKTFGFVLVAVLALAFSSACGKNGGSSCINPNAPGCSGDTPPDQSKYEPLGTRHYLKDANGNDTAMWVSLLSVSPPRGSVLTYGNTNGICPSKCQQFTMEGGLDSVDNATGSSDFQVGWSQDCVNLSGDGWLSGGGPVASGGSATFGGGQVHYFHDFAPQCFLVSGRYPIRGTAVPVMGTTSLLLDYHPPQ